MQVFLQFTTVRTEPFYILITVTEGKILLGGSSLRLFTEGAIHRGGNSPRGQFTEGVIPKGQFDLSLEVTDQFLICCKGYGSTLGTRLGPRTQGITDHAL